jgi:hypothetical protein
LPDYHSELEPITSSSSQASNYETFFSEPQISYVCTESAVMGGNEEISNYLAPTTVTLETSEAVDARIGSRFRDYEQTGATISNIE